MKPSYYIINKGKRLHFYMLGKGPALVLLHPSPHTADILLPLAKKLSIHFTVFAIDTPGYGKSDSLDKTPQSVKDYTTFLHECFEKMNLNKPSLYGSATGAQLAIRYALEYSDEVNHLFLDNAAHFDDAFCNSILQQYFPDLTPQLNGNHLPKLWQMVSQMFQYFPWCFTEEKYALNRSQLPAQILNSIALDFLRAGANYHLAYKLAFKHERGKYVQALKVPTTILNWSGSIIKPYIDDLVAFKFSKRVKVFEIDGGQEERLDIISNYIKDTIDKPLDYNTAEGIKTFYEEALRPYFRITEDLPEIRLEGTHLYKAWKQLVCLNPDLSAATIQSCLVDSYS